METELERLKAVEAERLKWEAKEACWLERERAWTTIEETLNTQLEQAEHLLDEERRKTTVPVPLTGEEESDGETSSVEETEKEPGSSTKFILTEPGGESQTVLSALEALLSTAWRAQQSPQLNAFSGDDVSGAGETFVDWIERLEMIAEVMKWDEQAKMVHLVTRLKGPAAAFYRSCTPGQKNDCEMLKAELKKRFTPVQFPPMQAGLFHKRRQKEGETVDEFAQDLLYRAYPQVKSGSTEANKMGETVLTSQFVVGL